MNIYTKEKYSFEGLTNDPENLNPYSKTYFNSVSHSLFFGKKKKKQDFQNPSFLSKAFVIEKKDVYQMEPEVF